MMSDMLGLLSDDELDRMKSRAWYRAGRAWQEARQPGLSNAVRVMLSDEAFAEEQFVNACIREISERKERATA